MGAVVLLTAHVVMDRAGHVMQSTVRRVDGDDMM